MKLLKLSSLFVLLFVLLSASSSIAQGEKPGGEGVDPTSIDGKATGKEPKTAAEKLDARMNKDGSTIQPRSRFDASSKPDADGADKKGISKAKGAKDADKKGDTKEIDDKEKEAKDKENERKKKARKEDDEEPLLFQTRSALPAARIFGQQFFRDNSISVFTGARKVEALDKYILDAGDEISLSIWGDAVYSGVFPVAADGSIDFSEKDIKIPKLFVRGMTFEKARKLILAEMRRFVEIKGPNTQAQVILNHFRNIVVNITGEVFTPGAFTIPATNTAFNALVASGGPNQIGSVRMIKVFSSGKEPKTLDVYKYLNNPATQEEFFLSNNDYIFVPLAGRVVNITGAVKRPFFYELVDGENLIKLVEYAGNFQPDAYKTNVQIKRFVGDEETLIDINLGKLITDAKDFDLRDGDEIIISPILQSYSNYVDVDGAVKLPGQYELESNKTKLSEVLDKSGILGSARTDRIYVIRIKDDLSKEYIRLSLENVLKDKESPENIILRPFDKIRIDPKARFRNDHNIAIYGAVREPGVQIYSPNLTLKDVIFLSGGLKEEAANNRIEISRIVKGKEEDTHVIVHSVEIDDDLSIQSDFLLEPFDEVFVRKAPEFELQRNIYMNGEVRFPGQYTLIDKNERVLSLIQRAGGLTDAAFLEGAYMIRNLDNIGKVILNLKDVMANPNSNYNYILQEGDSIHIPKIKDLVTLKGKVNYPPIDSGQIAQISVPWFPGKNAKWYVDEYGAGVNRVKMGRKRLIYVTYANGQIKKTKKVFLFFLKYPKVKKGSVVSVEPYIKKKKEPTVFAQINWGQMLPGLLSSSTAALTLVILARNAFK